MTEEKLKRLTNEFYNARNGNRIRDIVKVVAKTYEKNPVEIMKYFNHEDRKIAGIATSAYHLLTGDLTPMCRREFGGLGAIINDSEFGLTFGRNQLQFSENSGVALTGSKNSEYALCFSENSGYALRDSENSGSALNGSKNSGSALRDSENSEDALCGSENSEDALRGSENTPFVLRDSKNS